MANSWRIAALADKHRAMGSNLEDWNGMPTAWTYSNSGYTLADEHEAIRTKAGLMDVSGLKKVHYVGPHAESLLEWATTRDISKLYPGKSVYAAMLNEALGTMLAATIVEAAANGPFTESKALADASRDIDPASA